MTTMASSPPEVPYAAWDDDIPLPGGQNETLYGSYIVNLWAANFQSGESDRDPMKFWRTPSAKGAAYAPLLMDRNWFNVEPEPYDEPWETREQMVTMGWEGGTNEMKRVCIDRHGSKVTGSFLDMSVKTVGLKDLWMTKWHKLWPTDCLELPDPWPDWLAHLADPCPAGI
jgi:hypothetical protein